jgi:hypothetical protein
MKPRPQPSRSNSSKTATSSFGDFKRQLIESVLGPVRDAILRSSWPVRALVLCSIVSAGLLWKTALSMDWSLVREMSVAWRHRGVLQLRASEVTKVEHAISTDLSPYLAAELRNAYSTPDKYTAWTVSQMTVALLGGKEADEKTVPALLDRMRYANCHCWKVVSSEPVQDMASLNWVAFALAKLGQKLPSTDIAIILSNQHDGWWPAFSSATDDQANASTYATAWSVLALNEQMRLGIEEPQLSEVQGMIDRGKGWLLNTKMSGKARWLDYPNAVGTLGKETIGISGLVVHVLHRLGADTRDIDAEWMRDLPVEIPKPGDWDANPVFVAMPNTTWVQDNARQLRLPWTIIATVDAYQNGALSDQGRANKWFRQLTNQIGPQVRTLMSSNLSWAAAELTIALRYLGRKQHVGADVV